MTDDLTQIGALLDGRAIYANEKGRVFFTTKAGAVNDLMLASRFDQIAAREAVHLAGGDPERYPQLAWNLWPRGSDGA